MLRSKQPRQETNVYSIRMERNRKHAWTGIRENRTSSRNDHRDVHRGQVEMRVKRIGHVALPKIYIYIFLNENLTRREARNWGIDRWRNRVFCFSRNLKEGRGRFRGKKRSARQRSTFVRFSFDFRIICILLGGQVRSKSFIDGKLEEVEDITDEIERSKDRSEM